MITPLFAQEKLDVSGLVEGEPPAAAVEPGNAVAGSPDDGSSTETNIPPKGHKSIIALIHAGGPIGYVIILLSFTAVALAVEHCLTLRQKTVMPPGFADEVVRQLAQGQLAAAITRCKENQSVLAQILAAAMPQYEFGWDAVEKSAEEAMAEQAARLYRKVEYLNVIGNIAPMLGLLGTVVGMVVAFQQLAESGGYAKASDLAEGIYLALITTVEGLVVAIPALAAYSFFNNRIASLMNETAFIAEQVLRPIKKSLAKRS
ncbi:MAG: MotA/TolQ/ExbB proton channel family protein [Planctomycetaceae bacterium]|nr:MotA/TolQ/ExbB proton channel family protein [Planctomycetaceae bacterium]